MMLRRLGTGVPLAVFVAVLAHVAGFGRGHAPGEGHAPDLLVGLAVALATHAASVLARGLLDAARGVRPSPRDASRRDASRRRSGRGRLASAAGLGGLAVLALAAIEIAEGHLPTGGSLRALAAVLPLATLVAALASRAKRSIRALGARLGATLFVALRDVAPTFASHDERRVIASSIAPSGRRRGRAPPRTA